MHQLDLAYDELAENEGRDRFKTCTRCKKEFEPENPKGCKRHRIYYMGGTIMVGK